MLDAESTAFHGLKHTKTSQRVHSINIHGAGTTNSFTARTPECQGRVDLVFNPYQGVQHHRSSLIQIQRVALHLGLRCGLIWVPSVDVERLDLAVLLWLRLLDCRRFGFGDGRSCRIGYNLFGNL